MTTTLRLGAAALALMASLGAHAATADSLLGTPEPVAEATRTVVISPSTRYVNVTYGETVRFVDQGQAFAVRFDGTRSSFDLRALAPDGTLHHAVQAYVMGDPGNDD